jgi:hypothetical protein
MGNLPIGKETQTSIRTLCKKLTLEYPQAEWEPNRTLPLLIGVVPDDINIDKSKPRSIFLFGEYYRAYHETLERLRKEVALEYMDCHELKERFWHFVCEVVIGYEAYRDVTYLDRRINEFLSGITKPVADFEILVPILNLDVKDSEIRIGNVSIRKLTQEGLEELGFPREHYCFDRIANNTVAIIPEKGNAPGLIVDRARKKADIVMRVLQASISMNLFVFEEKTLFRQGKCVAYRETGNPSNRGFVWHRGYEPIPLELSDVFRSSVDNFLEKIPELYQGELGWLSERLTIALTWIGRAIDEQDLDIKVAHLSTALESMLTTRSDKKKGETLAYRMILLNMCLDRPFIHPDQVVSIYELRSKVVHGSTIGEASKDDYYTVKRLAVETLIHMAEFARKEELESHNAFLKALDSSKHVDDLLDWLGKQGTKTSLEIRDCVMEMREAQSCA